MSKIYNSVDVFFENELLELIPFMDLIGFEGFFEKEQCTVGYIDNSKDIQRLAKLIENKFGDRILKIEIQEIENENWNQTWESNFDPVFVDDLCAIVADFHEIKQDCTHTIHIRPKMAFGTGHHETTYMMIQAMNTIDIKDKSIFDFGTGTGILAVFASKLGAKQIIANDIQEETKDNYEEHLEINNVETPNTFYLASLDGVKESNFDVILANINKKVLIASSEILFQKLNDGGFLLISGIMKKDKDGLVNEYTTVGFTLLEVKEKGEWHCIKFQKPI